MWRKLKMEMALHIAFEKSADSMIKKLVKILAGPYVHTEMIISQTEPRVHTAYSAYMNSTFARTFQKDFFFSDETHDFIRIEASPEELERVCKACEACVESKVPYNTQDMVFSQMPLRCPTDRDLFHSSALFCSQAAVLILRSCLEEDHPVLPHLAAINSRTVSPSQLYSVLEPVCQVKSKKEVFF